MSRFVITFLTIILIFPTTAQSGTIEAIMDNTTNRVELLSKLIGEFEEELDEAYGALAHSEKDVRTCAAIALTKKSVRNSLITSVLIESLSDNFEIGDCRLTFVGADELALEMIGKDAIPELFSVSSLEQISPRRVTVAANFPRELVVAELKNRLAGNGASAFFATAVVSARPFLPDEDIMRRLFELSNGYGDCPNLYSRAIEKVFQRKIVDFESFKQMLSTSSTSAYGGGLPLCSSDISDEQLRRVLSRFPRITRLELPSSISDSGLNSIAGLKHLKDLTLNGCQVSSDGLSRLVRSGNLTAIKLVDLPEGAMSKIEDWLPIKNLHSISLNGTNLGLKQLEWLAEFPKFESLTLLEGFDASLLPELDRIEKLRSLDISDCDFSEKELQQIRHEGLCKLTLGRNAVESTVGQIVTQCPCLENVRIVVQDVVDQLMIPRLSRRFPNRRFVLLY